MPYNNLETQVTSVSYTWSGSAVSFSTLGLSTSIPFKDQIEVERIFSSAGFNAVKDTITPKDLHKIFLLEKTEYDITGNTISGFSGLTGSRVYTLTDGTSRTVTIPAISNGDSIVIRRKTLSMDTYVTWAPGTKLTTTQLNQQVGQLLRLNQELIYKLDTEYVRASDLTGTTAPITSLNNSLNMNSYTINNLGNFSSTVGDGNNSYAVNKGYIDTNFVNRSTAQTGIAGAKTFTGAITLSSTLAVTGAVTLSSGLTVDTNTLVVDATNDRVGIGTTNPSQKLHVNAGTIRVDNTDANGTSLISTGTGASGSNFQVAHKTTSYVTVLNSGGGIAFETNSTGEKMRIEPAGNLILGNATAAGNIGRALDIYNYATGASAASLIRLITHDAGAIPAPASIGQIIKYQTGGFAIHNTDQNAAAHIRLDVGDSERMRIDSAGKVGIGTNNPSTRLQIAVPSTGTTLTGTSRYGGIHLTQTNTNDEFTGITTTGPNSSSTNGGILFQSSGTYGTKLHFLTTDEFAAGLKNRMTLNHFGNLGIGTASPDLKLHVVGNTKIQSGTAGGVQSTVVNMSGLHLDGGIADTSTSSIFYSSGGGGGAALTFLRNAAYSTGIALSTNSAATANTTSERVRIDGDGNVGIGTASPTTKLAVNGTTSISGVTTVSSTAVSTSTTSGALQVAGGVGIGGALYVGSVSVLNDNATVNGVVQATGQVYCGYGAAPSAANSAAGLCATFSNVNVGIYVVAAGTTAPTFTAPKGSLCINTTATAAGNRLYINKDGSTAWAAITAAS